MAKMAGDNCITHQAVKAEYYCTQCSASLCAECVFPDAHLLFCSRCRGIAQRLVTLSDEPRFSKENLAEASATLKEIALVLVNHVFLPIAIITMVSAFLFYLLDVRSVYWSGGASLKRIGFFMVMATVLIARYGKVYSKMERQMLYTQLLAFATLLAMLRQTGFGIGFLVNILIIYLVWRLAFGVTNQLNIEEKESKENPGEIRMYGVTRLHHEAMEAKHHLQLPHLHALQRGAIKRSETPIKELRPFFMPVHDPHGNASGAVARLVGLAILFFALGEPILLSGPREVGIRAMMAVIVFLFSAAVVLAAASAVGTYQLVVQDGGKGSLGLVPMKVFLVVVMMVVILALGFTIPGLHYEGSGKIQPPQKIDGQGEVNGKADKEGNTSGERESQDQQHGKGGQGKNGKSKTPDSSGLNTLVNFFTQLGKWLLIPAIIAFIGFVLYALVKLLPMLRGMGLGNWWQKWREKWRSKNNQKQKEIEINPDPIAILSKLPGLPPQEAIMGAYFCLLVFFQQVGYKQVMQLTPYEILTKMPQRLIHVKESARGLIDIYIKTAYSTFQPTEQISKEALKLLLEIKQQLAAATTKA